MSAPAFAVPARAADAPLKGILLRSSAVACFAVMFASIKLAAAAGAGTLELLFYRNLVSLPVVLAWAAVGPGFAALATRRPSAQASRAAIGLVAMILNFTAVALLPLAEATALGFSAPLFGTALSALLLDERVGRHRWSAVAVGFVGVLVVVRPFGATLPAASVLVGLVAAVATAVSHVTMRQIGATEGAVTTVFWFSLASLAATALAMPFVAHAATLRLWPVLLALGLSGGVAQLLVTASLRHAPIATLAPFDYVQLVWAALLGWWLFASPPAAATLAGGAVIAASGLYIVWRERRRRPATAATADPEI